MNNQQQGMIPDMATVIKQRKIVADAELEVCPECGCKFYDEVVVVKKINGLLIGSPNSYEYQPVPVYICRNCHKLAPFVLENPQIKEIIGQQFGEDVKKTEDDKSSLIINP